MQPHPPQLPTDAPTSPAPKNLKKGALILAVAVAIVAALIALVLPEKQIEANKAPKPAQQSASGRVQQAQSDAYKAPTR
jgi:hypothetical protein